MIIRDLKSIAKMINANLNDKKYEDVTIQGINIDSRKIEPNNLFIPINGQNANGHHFIQNAINNKANATLWNKDEPNPPTDIGVLFVDDTVKAMQELAKSYRRELKTSIIGISGSNGKTSTKDILAGLLSSKYKTQKTMANYNNELGVPITILSLDEDCEVAVVEMGMEKKGELLFLKDIVKPNNGILTNVGICHIENFDCLQSLSDAKCELLDCLNTDGLFIYNGDDKHIVESMKHKKINNNIKLKTFGHNNNNNIYYTDIMIKKDGIIFKCDGEINGIFELNILGKHQAQNAISAILMAKEYGLSINEIINGFKKIQKTGLRNEIVKIKKCTILNDSYKSNPDSVLAALDTFENIKANKKIVVLGDMLGLGENEIHFHEEIGHKLSNFTITELITIGTLGKSIANGAKENVKNIVSFDDKESMTDYLSKYLNEDSVIVIKASRSFELDKVVENLKNCY